MYVSLEPFHQKKKTKQKKQNVLIQQRLSKQDIDNKLLERRLQVCIHALIVTKPAGFFFWVSAIFPPQTLSSQEKMHSAGVPYSSDKAVCQPANLMIVSRQVQLPSGQHASQFQNNGQLPGGSLLKGCSQELHLPSNSPQIQTCALEQTTFRDEMHSKQPKLPSERHATVEKCPSVARHESRDRFFQNKLFTKTE